jgi:hypothetical protein
MAIAILHSEPKAVTPGKMLVVAARKTTKLNPVPDNQKYRAVEIAPFITPLLVNPGEAEGAKYDYQENALSLFRQAIAEAFLAAAVEILKEYTTANPDAKEMSEDALSVSAIVTKMEGMQTSQRLDGDQITAWYDASKTKSDAAGRYTESEKGKKQQAALREKFISLASNNPGIDPALATKMLGYLNADDTSSPVCAAIAKKLDRISKQATADDL